MTVRASLIVLLVVLRAADAAADNQSPADAAFALGRARLAEGKYEAACAAFQDSLRLDFQYGTLFNIADCSAKLGKLATSLAAWRRIAKEDHNTGRAQKAAELAARLEPRVPRIRVSITPAVPGTHVMIDGTEIADLAAPVLVDLGPHHIVATAPQRLETRRELAVDQEGVLIPVEITLAIEPSTNLMSPEPTAAPPGPASSGHAFAGKVMFGAGAVTVAGGLVIGGLALRAWNNVQTTAHTDPSAANRDLPHVRLLGNVSTALIAVGTVAAAAGFYLWRSGRTTATAGAALEAHRATVAVCITF